MKFSLVEGEETKVKGSAHAPSNEVTEFAGVTEAENFDESSYSFQKSSDEGANMRNKLFVFCAALVVVLLALAPLTQGQKAGTSAVVPLRVTIEPTDSNNIACKICGDGLGEYVDGIDGVSA